MSRRSCLDCHYLFKSAADGGGKEHSFPWNTSDRERGRPKGEHWTSSCHKRVWNANRNQIPESKVDAEISKKRKRKECPFFEYRCDLEVHEVEELQRSKKNWWQRIPKTIWAAILVASVVLGYVADVVGLLETEWVEENVKSVIKWFSHLLVQEQ